MNDDFDLKNLGTKKKKINSRTKGQAFERKICKMLNERFNTTEFSRSPGSGAFATSHKNLPDYLKIHGDIITPMRFKWMFELKKGYNSIHLGDLLNKKSKLWEFITQMERDSLVGGKQAMLILAHDRQEPLVICRSDYMECYTSFDDVAMFDGYCLMTLAAFLECDDDCLFYF